MPSKGTAQSQKSASSIMYATSYLVWAMIVVILLLWCGNVYELVIDYRKRIAQRVDDHQQQQLDGMRLEVEEVFRKIYEHSRTISLLPSVRSVEGGNRHSDIEDVVEQGRLALDTHYTIEQIYKNLSSTAHLSEIYYVLDGFNPDAGEVPFFMYDDEIVGINDNQAQHRSSGLEDIPEEYELEEYRYYQRQLQWYRENFSHWSYFDKLSQIPALTSPLVQTCDNTQYASVGTANITDSFGLLYSVPVFDIHTQQFKGIISAVLRANVLEAMLVGVPFIPITAEEQQRAGTQNWQMPEVPAGFLLANSRHDIAIHDRRNSHFSDTGLDHLAAGPGSLQGLELDVVSDGRWQLHHYLSQAQVQQLGADLTRSMWWGIATRVGLLLVLLAIFLRANRDQRRHQQELVQLAHYDSLTMLPNRSLLYLHLGQSLSRARRHRRKLGLMFVDIDDFGSINDTLGHKAGDAVLMAIAGRLRQSIRLSDEVASLEQGTGQLQVSRLGGDDFAIIFEDMAYAEDGVMLGERLLLKFRDPIYLDGQKAEVSLSGGLAVYPDDAKDIDDLMGCADYALRHAAERGVGQFQMYNDEMRQRAARQTRLMQDIPNAIRFELFSLNYQPKQSLADDRVVSFEALLRWNHETFGFVSPVEFIPLLEQSGYIVEVGRWVLETACRQLKTWQQQGNPELCMSVNVSPRQLILSDIVATVDEVLAETGIAPHTLILEITESIMIDNLEEGNRTLAELKRRGIKLAIDDFGTGYSSLTYLQELPIDYLKLDKSMIDVIEEERGAHVIRITIDLALGLGLKTIAEGVEQRQQRDLLKAMGCDMIQGYWLSRPQLPEQLGPYLDGVSLDPDSLIA